MNLDDSNIKIFDLNKTYNLFNLNAKQGDTTGARGILFRIIKDSIPFSLNELTIQLGGVKPDGTNILNSVSILDAENSIVAIDLTTQILSVAGILKLELIFIKNDTKLSSYPFEINIIKTITNFKNIVSSDEFGILNEALKKVNGYNEELKEAVESGKNEVYTNIKNDFEPLKADLNIAITNGGNEVSKLEVLEKEYSSKINELNNSNTLDIVKKDLNDLAIKQNSDITWTNENVTTNTKELEKFTYSKINTFNCEKSKTGVIRIWGYKAVSSNKDGVWVTIQLPFELPNKNYTVILTPVDGRVDSSFRRIKLGNNQSISSFDVFIDWCVGFNFYLVCQPN